MKTQNFIKINGRELKITVLGEHKQLTFDSGIKRILRVRRPLKNAQVFDVEAKKVFTKERK